MFLFIDFKVIPWSFPSVSTDVNLLAAVEGRGWTHLEVDPVHAVPHVLEHALKGHEEVAVFEARLTTAGREGPADVR